MRTVVAFPGSMTHAQNIALALMEAGALEAFVTGFAWRRHGSGARFLAALPKRVSSPALRQLERRSIDGVEGRLVHSYPFWEIVRTCASRFGAEIWADRAWDRLSQNFDRLVARNYVPRVQAVQGFEYTSLRTFERARDEGVARILHLPSLDSRSSKLIWDAEKRSWPELRSPTDSYFDAVFERRYERRQMEIALADVIITNSRLTAQSHIAAGAPAEKVVSIPLAAPVPIAAVRDRERSAKRPFVALWAGSFSLGKGAHHMIRAWQALAAGSRAHLEVYGLVGVPERLIVGVRDTVTFHGSVPRGRLFEAYQQADVLVFPTLYDGFGMVVTEAMANGLPVITTDQAGATDFVTADNGIVVPAADAEALKQALAWCLDNRTRLAEMRHHALATARSRQWPDFRYSLIENLNKRLLGLGYPANYNLAAVGRSSRRAAS